MVLKSIILSAILALALLISACTSDAVNTVVGKDRVWNNPIDSLSTFAHLRGPDLIDDRDSQIYRTLYIGDYLWMAQDLQYNNGPHYTWAQAMELPDSLNSQTYGPQVPLQGLCPNGWRIPTLDDWHALLLSTQTLVQEYDSSTIYGAPEHFKNWFMVYDFSSQGFGYSDRIYFAPFHFRTQEVVAKDGLNLVASSSYWSSQESSPLTCNIMGVSTGCFPKAYSFIAREDWSDDDVQHGYFGLGPDLKQNQKAVRCVSGLGLTVASKPRMSRTLPKYVIAHDSLTVSIQNLVHSWSLDSLDVLQWSLSTQTQWHLIASASFKILVPDDTGDSISLFLMAQRGSIIEIDTLKFRPWNTMTDTRDGEIYLTTTILNQVWMAENLRFNMDTLYLPGIGYGSMCSPKGCAEHGRLYPTGIATLEADPEVIGSTGICPEGWHVPLYTEFQDLDAALGISFGARSILLATSTHPARFNAISAGKWHPDYPNNPTGCEDSLSVMFWSRTIKSINNEQIFLEDYRVDEYKSTFNTCAVDNTVMYDYQFYKSIRCVKNP